MGAVVVGGFGDLDAFDVLVARRRHFQRGGQVGPKLEAVHAALRVALRHLLMHDAAACGHPLHVAGAEHAAIAEAVAVLHRAIQDIGDGLDAAMRMPGEAGEIVLRVVVAEIVEQQKRIGLGSLAETKGAAQLDAGAFHGGRRLRDAFHGSDGHGTFPCALTSLSLPGLTRQSMRPCRDCSLTLHKAQLVEYIMAARIRPGQHCFTRPRRRLSASRTARRNWRTGR